MFKRTIQGCSHSKAQKQQRTFEVTKLGRAQTKITNSSLSILREHSDETKEQ